MYDARERWKTAAAGASPTINKTYSNPVPRGDAEERFLQIRRVFTKGGDGQTAVHVAIWKAATRQPESIKQVAENE